MNTNEKKPKSVLNLESSISIDEEDVICKSLSCSEFLETCSRLNYRQLCQISDELNLRASRMQQQIQNRTDDNSNWRNRVDSALRIINQKILIISSRISSIRNNNINLIITNIGGFKNITSKRLALIKCLLSIIDNNSGFSNLSLEENSIIDVCRDITDSILQKRRGFSYDLIRNAVISPDGSDVAVLSSNSVHSEEYGYTMSRSWDMAALLDSTLPFFRSIMDDEECTEDEYCLHCRAKDFTSKVSDMLSDLR